MKKNIIRILIGIGTTLLETILTFIFQEKLETMNTFIEHHFIGLFLIFIIITVIIIISIFFIKDTIHSINLLKVKSKYYDIMINKMNTTKIYHVFDDDLKLFSKKEKKYLDEYLEQKQLLRIIQKGINKTFGAFKD